MQELLCVNPAEVAHRALRTQQNLKEQEPRNCPPPPPPPSFPHYPEERGAAVLDSEPWHRKKKKKPKNEKHQPQKELLSASRLPAAVMSLEFLWRAPHPAITYYTCLKKKKKKKNHWKHQRFERIFIKKASLEGVPPPPEPPPRLWPHRAETPVSGLTGI